MSGSFLVLGNTLEELTSCIIHLSDRRQRVLQVRGRVQRGRGVPLRPETGPEPRLRRLQGQVRAQDLGS